MASGGGVEKEWRQIEEEITCSICGDLFTDPKTIPCLHTFCKQCIERSIESNKKMAVIVCCPLCRAPLPQDGIASIPTNFTINRLVEIYGKRKESEQISVTMKCGKCEEDAPSITWCLHCEEALCRDCNELHRKWKDFKSHKTVPISEFLQNPKQAVATPEKAELCKSHTKQTLDLYCKTCSSLICRDCTLKDHPRGHRDHDFDFVDEVVDEQREKMKQVTAPLKQLLERVRNGVKKIEHCEKQVDIESEANIDKIRAAYGEVYKLLQQQEEETVGKVNTIKTSFKKTLTVQKESAKFLESQLVSCDEFTERLVTVNRTRQLLTYNKWIENRVDEVTKQVEHFSLDPECKPSDMIVICHHPVEFVNDSVCDVSCLPHLPDCTVSGPVVISDPVKVTVTLKDIFGSPVVNQSNDLEIRCNKEREFLQNTHIEEESRGQYHIWYNPKRKEGHSLSVYWRGLEVNHEEIKVLTNIRDYNKLKQEVKIIDKYGLTNRKLEWPYLLAKGPNNELIVRDNSTKQLVVFDKHFQYSHVIGGAGSGNGKFQWISGIAVDKKGYLYIADSDLHCIRKFKLNGNFISQFGSKGTANSQFQNPRGLVLSQSELLFVCDNGNNRIKVFQNEQFSYCFGQRGTEPGTFNGPVDLALNNSEDQLFITNGGNNRVQAFTLKGQFLKVIGDFTDVPFKLQSPIGIHYTPDGHLLVSSQNTHCVLVFEEDGKFISAIEGTYQGKKRFSNPCGVVMMDDGQIVIADGSFGGNRIVVF
ncbi:E3 ubiquitin-protein ligase TRIM71-like [Dysidea avara]|uniref:E3 ubiquitin-protein ligase TRIM71-like n=1 Tax=Dysidea avara TaxID=196820 RepID=UPI00331981AA